MSIGTALAVSHFKYRNTAKDVRSKEFNPFMKNPERIQNDFG
jgi:hypothetical protein